MRDISQYSATLGIVLSGGGNLCAYQVGALRALAEVHRVTTPKVLVADSGGVAPGLLALTGHFDEMYEWPRLCDDPRLISWFRGDTIYDTEFWVNGIISPQVPNLREELSSVHTKIFLPATEIPQGDRHWFSNPDLVSPLEVMRAVISIPGISGSGVNIGNRRFIDGSFSTSVADCVVKAFVEGAERVVLLDNSMYGRPSVLTQALMRWKTRGEPETTRALVEKYLSGVTRKKRLSTGVNVVVCRPARVALRHQLDRGHARALRTMQQGYDDMARLQLE